MQKFSWIPLRSLQTLLLALASACAALPPDGAQMPDTSTLSLDAANDTQANPLPAPGLTAAALPQTQRPQQLDIVVNLRVNLEQLRDDESLQRENQRLREQLLAQLPRAEVQVRRMYALVPAIALRVTPEVLRLLPHLPEVASVQEDWPMAASLKFVGPLVQTTAAHAKGFTGKGVRVAVIDTGVDATHPDLAGRVAAQHCFVQGGCPPYGQSESTSAKDEDGHGTHVAGIVLGAGKVAGSGMAPEADLVAVRVLDKNGSGSDSDIIAGLDWVAANAKTLNIRVVNMSLGSQQHWAGSCDKADAATATAVKLLGKKGVTVFAAAGNEGVLNGLSNPACLTNVLSVGALYTHDLASANYPGLCKDKSPKTGTFACFSNRSKHLTIVAPGAPIVSLGVGGGTATMSGTSQATPVVAGVAALLLACKPALTGPGLAKLLQQSGKTVADPATGLQFKMVQASNALALACP